MTKAMVCSDCVDVVSPYRDWQTNRAWRWCSCGNAGVRWRDGNLGHLEVTAAHGSDCVRVLGLNNRFLVPAIAGVETFGFGGDDLEEWRLLHDQTCEDVARSYLFHESKRHCWAVIIRVGETGDVRFVDYPTARHGDQPAKTPGSSTDRASG